MLTDTGGRPELFSDGRNERVKTAATEHHVRYTTAAAALPSAGHYHRALA